MRLRYVIIKCETEPEAVKRVKKPVLEKFFREHNSMRKETNDLRIAQIKEAVPPVTDQAVINCSVLMVKALSQQMKTTIEAIRGFDREIEALCQTHQDYHLFGSRLCCK